MTRRGGNVAKASDVVDWIEVDASKISFPSFREQNVRGRERFLNSILNFCPSCKTSLEALMYREV
jgi:hypothetical protein